MAKSNRSTNSAHRFNPKNLSREGRKMHEAIKMLVGLPVAVPAPAFAFLPRTQRLRLADLAAATNTNQEHWIQRAVDLFLEVEAPVYASR